MLCFIVFLATRHAVVKDLAFSSPLNDPPRGMYGIHEGVPSRNHCPLEVQVEEKDYNTNTKEVTSLYIQYRSQHGKNKQELKREQVWHWKVCAKWCSNESGRKVPPRQYSNQR